MSVIQRAAMTAIMTGVKLHIEDAIASGQIVRALMLDDVEPRRNVIELNALRAGSLERAHVSGDTENEKSDRLVKNF
jgi:hypothetical protein